MTLREAISEAQEDTRSLRASATRHNKGDYVYDAMSPGAQEAWDKLCLPQQILGYAVSRIEAYHTGCGGKASDLDVAIE